MFMLLICLGWCMNIAIFHENIFLSLGLEASLIVDKRVRTIRLMGRVERLTELSCTADLIIVSWETFQRTICNGRCGCTFIHKKIVILSQWHGIYQCCPLLGNGEGFIKLKEISAMNIIQIITTEQFEDLSPKVRDCNMRDMRSAFNVFELRVLFFISLGYTVTQCAKILMLRIKVASYHKRTAMKKLGFTSNAELYSWIKEVNFPRLVFT